MPIQNDCHRGKLFGIGRLPVVQRRIKALSQIGVVERTHFVPKRRQIRGDAPQNGGSILLGRNRFWRQLGQRGRFAFGVQCGEF